jgi:hypothetical protein
MAGMRGQPLEELHLTRPGRVIALARRPLDAESRRPGRRPATVLSRRRGLHPRGDVASAAREAKAVRLPEHGVATDAEFATDRGGGQVGLGPKGFETSDR